MHYVFTVLQNYEIKDIVLVFANTEWECTERLLDVYENFDSIMILLLGSEINLYKTVKDRRRYLLNNRHHIFKQFPYFGNDNIVINCNITLKSL